MSLKELENYGPFNYFYNVKDQMQRHIYDRTTQCISNGENVRDAISSVEELDAYRARMRDKFLDILGGLPSFDTPLNAQVVGTIKEDGLRIEKIIFESRPNVFVTALMYIPDGLSEPSGAVQFLCGHAFEAKFYERYQRVCRFIADSGLIVFAQDPVGQGERHSYWDPRMNAVTVNYCTQEHDYAGGQCLPMGHCLAKYFVHDAMRGIDYLLTRPEVDPNRIGVTGNSGGGTQTSMMMMCDPRIAAAAPGTFIMNRETYMYSGGAQDAEQIWPEMTAYGWDHEDILLMIAPKPLKVLSVKYDYFPIEGARRSVGRVARFWEMYDKRENLSQEVDISIHSYTDNLAIAAAEFFSEKLNGKKVTPDPARVVPAKPSTLYCTKSGQVQGEIPGACFIYEENCIRLDEIEAAKAKMAPEERKRKAIDWLKKEIHKYRTLCEPITKVYFTQVYQQYQVERSFWWSQPGIMNAGMLLRRIDDIGEKLPVTVAVWDGGTKEIESHANWIEKTTNQGRAVLVLDTTGVGNIEPYQLNSMPMHEFYGVIHKFNDDLLWLDDSVANLRTYDVTRSIDAIADWPGLDSTDVVLYGYGRQSVYAQLAKAIDSRFKSIELENEFRSFADWVRQRHYNNYDIRSIIVRGILKYTDLPELMESE